MKNINGNHVGMRLAVLGWMLCTMLSVYAQNVRETIRLDEGWKFSLGNAADLAKDYGCGTEYFNYLTKANSIHNEGPYSIKFNHPTVKGMRSIAQQVLMFINK